MRADEMAVSIGDTRLFPTYERLWRHHDRNSFFRSPGHLQAIARLTDSQLKFAVATQRGASHAMLPFAVRDGALGPVINSLPFFGTYSAVVGPADPGLSNELAATVLAYGRESGAVSATFIEDWRDRSLRCLPNARFVTGRTNQFIDLNKFGGANPIDRYHQKTRNLVRKAIKVGMRVRRSTNADDLVGLREVHERNMSALGGLAKPPEFFVRLQSEMAADAETILYIANYDGTDCAYLLLIACGDTIEYYMPAVNKEHRSLQPLSLLIHTAIVDAVEGGYRFWNFGGTWPTQESLRHFKSRWGGEEAVYNYHTYILNEDVLSICPARLAEAYPMFFVAPFDKLEPGSGEAAR